MIGDKAIDHVVYLKAEFLSHTLISNKKTRIVHNCGRSVLEQVGVLFNRGRLLHDSLSFVLFGVSSSPGEVTHRSCTNFKCKLAM